MYRYIYGFDRNDPIACAKNLYKKGIRAVVTAPSGASYAPIFSDEGIDLYLCYGAHGLGNDHSGKRICKDASGTERIWFSSGCPNDISLAEANMNAALDALNPGIKGIFVDGARFASFASSEGTDAFFTCFCPECMEKMADMGMDPEKIRASVSELKQKRISPDTIPYLSDWLRFRSACVKAYMDNFVRRVHAIGSEFKAGAFIFEPLLAPFVGQTAEACASLDIIAPMLYRNYPHETGPACMGHEWAAFVGMFGEAVPKLLNIAGVDNALPAGADSEALLSRGFTPEAVGSRVAVSKKNLKQGQSLWPILQIEDERLCDTEGEACSGGADAVGYFMYGQSELPDKENI